MKLYDYFLKSINLNSSVMYLLKICIYTVLCAIC